MKILQRCLANWKRLICKILKSLYDLNQVKRLWNKTIIKFFWRIDFTCINADTCIFIFKKRQELIIIGIYVDYLILESKSLEMLEWLKNQLITEFNMKDLGKVKTIIEWEITHKEDTL